MAAPAAASRFQRLWNSEVGPKTVHFCMTLASPHKVYGVNKCRAPVMKWGLATITFSQMTQPANTISPESNFALMCTGILWTRWSLIIKPRNVLLASCNAFLAVGAATQLARVYMYNKEQKALKRGEKAPSAA